MILLTYLLVSSTLDIDYKNTWIAPVWLLFKECYQIGLVGSIPTITLKPCKLGTLPRKNKIKQKHETLPVRLIYRPSERWWQKGEASQLHFDSNWIMIHSLYFTMYYLHNRHATERTKITFFWSSLNVCTLTCRVHAYKWSEVESACCTVLVTTDSLAVL